MKLWHVTSRVLLESILKEAPLIGPHLVGENGEDIHNYYAETIVSEGKGPVIIVIDAYALSVRSLAPDQNGLDEPLNHTLGISEDYVREEFDATVGTWRDCFDVFRTCRYIAAVLTTALSVRGGHAQETAWV